MTRSSRAPAASRLRRRSTTGSAWWMAGFDLLDVGAVPARSGPAVATRERGRAARPGGRGARPAFGCAGERRHVRGRGRKACARRGGRGDQRHLRRRRPRDAAPGRRAWMRLRADEHRRQAQGGSKASRARGPGRRPGDVVRRADRGGAVVRGRRGADRARPRSRLRPLRGRRPRDPRSTRRASTRSGARSTWRCRGRTFSEPFSPGPGRAARLPPSESGRQPGRLHLRWRAARTS